MIHQRLAAAAAAGAFLLAPEAAPAQEAKEEMPVVEWGVLIEVQNDWAVRSGDPAAELNDLFTTIEPEVRIVLAPWISLNAHGVIEPVLGPDAAEDRTFGDEGFYVDELFVELRHGNFGAHAGKFGANFGLAWDEAPGLYGTDFAEDYELSERIGVEAGISLGGQALGTHVLSASVFFLDTSFLSESAITNRGRTRLADGGPSNTEDLASFVVALDSAEIPMLDGLHTRLSVAHQEGGRGDTGDETGVSIGAVWAIEIDEDAAVTPIAEYAHFDDFGAVAGDAADYLTLGASVAGGPWLGALSYTARQIDGSAAADDWLVQASAGYEFANGIQVELAASRREEAGVETDIIGIVVRYALGGAFAP